MPLRRGIGGMMVQLFKKSSTKQERIVAEILKRNRVKFYFKKRVGKYEIDFIIGRLAIEIDGKVHKQTNTAKDTFLFLKGFVPVHFVSLNNLRVVEKEILFLIKSNQRREKNVTR